MIMLIPVVLLAVAAAWIAQTSLTLALVRLIGDATGSSSHIEVTP